MFEKLINFFKRKNKLHFDEKETDSIVFQIIEMIKPVLTNDVSSATKQLKLHMQEVDPEKKDKDVVVGIIDGYAVAYKSKDPKNKTGIRWISLVSNIRTPQAEESGFPFMGLELDEGAIEELFIDEEYLKNYMETIKSSNFED